MRQSIFGDKNLDDFLSQYDEQVYINVLKLREILFTNLPRIIEQIDIPARMIAYCYGQKYGDMICTIIPSKRGVKLGFIKVLIYLTRITYLKEQAKFRAT
jgi:hypothetical protein